MSVRKSEEEEEEEEGETTKRGAKGKSGKKYRFSKMEVEHDDEELDQAGEYLKMKRRKEEEIHRRSRQLLDCYREIQKLARLMDNKRLIELGISSVEAADVPRIVFLGFQSSGKSSVVEAFLGHPFRVSTTGGTTDQGLGTKSPICISSRYNQHYDTPRITLKLPGVSVEKTKKVRTVDELQSIVTQYYGSLKNEVSGQEIEVTWEYKRAFDIDIVDTIGYSDSIGKKIENINQRYIEDENNLLIFLVDGSSEMYAKKPKESVISHFKSEKISARTIFLITKCDNLKTKKGHEIQRSLQFDPIFYIWGRKDRNRPIRIFKKYFICLPFSNAQTDDWEKYNGIDETGNKNYMKVIVAKTKDVLNDLTVFKLQRDVDVIKKYYGFPKFKDALQRIISSKMERKLKKNYAIICQEYETKQKSLKILEQLLKDKGIEIDKKNLNIMKKVELTVKKFCAMFDSCLDHHNLSMEDEERYGQDLETERTKKVGEFDCDWSEEMRDSSRNIFPRYYQEKLVGGAQYKRLLSDIEIQIRCCHVSRKLTCAKFINSGGKDSRIPDAPLKKAVNMFPGVVRDIISIGKKRLFFFLDRLYLYATYSFRNMFLTEFEKNKKLFPIFEMTHVHKMFKATYQKFLKKKLSQWENELRRVSVWVSKMKIHVGKFSFKKRQEMSEANQRDKVVMSEMEDVHGNGIPISQFGNIQFLKKLNEGGNDKSEMEEILNRELRFNLFFMRGQMANLTWYISNKYIAHEFGETLEVLFLDLIRKIPIEELIKLFSVNVDVERRNAMKKVVKHLASIKSLCKKCLQEEEQPVFRKKQFKKTDEEDELMMI